MKPLVTVWSPKSEGATVTALHLATAFAKRHSTLLVDLNLRRPQLADTLRGLDLSLHNVDTVYPQAQVGSLTSELLRATVWQSQAQQRLSLMGGILHPENATNYDLGPLSHLLDLCSTTYPRVVADVGGELDTAGTEAALTHASCVLVVMRATLLSIRTYQRLRALLVRLGIDVSTHRLVLTSYRPDDPYEPPEVARECELPIAGIVPFCMQLDTALSVGQTLTPGPRANTSYLRSIDNLAASCHGEGE